MKINMIQCISALFLGSALVVGAPSAMSAATEGCAEPGDVCSDGTVLVAPSNADFAIYTTPADVERPKQWSHGDFFWTGENGAISEANGRSNTRGLTSLADSGLFPAAEYCATLKAHGHSDWYLPAITELRLLYNSRSEIGGFRTEPGARYWSSSEHTDIFAWTLDFSDGVRKATVKNGQAEIRCVRRQPL